MDKIDVFDILTDLEDFDWENYYEEEQTVLTPALKRHGYRVHGSWYSIEKDSFGPLVRGARAVDPDNNIVILWYG